MKPSTTPPAVQAQYDRAMAEAEALAKAEGAAQVASQKPNDASQPQEAAVAPSVVDAPPFIAKSLADLVKDEAPKQAATNLADAVAEPDVEVEKKMSEAVRERDQAKQQLSVLQGKYTAEVPRLHQNQKELEDKIRAQSDEIARMRDEFTSLVDKKQTDDAWKSRLTDEEKAEFKSADEALGVTGRAVLGEIEARERRLRAETEAKLAKIEQTLQKNATAEAETMFWAKLDAVHPTASKINKLPDFDTYLSTETDQVSGMLMRDVANAAARAGDLGRVLDVIKGYEQKRGITERPISPEVAGQIKPSAQGRASESVVASTKKPLITESMLKKFTQDVVRGRYGQNYLGNPEYKKIQKAIDDAVAENRIIAG